MSPAGHWPQLHAAIEAGADSVYFGLHHFTARAKVGFGLEELPEVMATLHRRGVKGYVTFNTLVFDHELSQAATALAAIAQAGADAIIVQDLGICALAHAIAPELEIHASTQMSVTSVEGVRLAQRLGATRVNLARELSLDDIRRIRAATACELEVFVHGALCVAYSGQCFSSEAWGGRSANRGQCAQACRLEYDLIVDGQAQPLGDARYLLSPGDLYALERIPELVDIGIASLKIEGRYKDAEYVALATEAYRQAVDAAWEGRPTRPAPRQRLLLEQVYSRGLGDFFLAGVNHQRVVQGRAPRHRGVLVGRVQEVLPNRVVLELNEVESIAPLKPGDGVVFDAADWRSPAEKEEGGHLYEVHRQGRRAEVAFANGAIDFSRIHPGDLLWRTHDVHVAQAAKPYLEPSAPVRRIPVEVDVIARPGTPLSLRWTAKGHTVEVLSPEPLTIARRQGLTLTFLEEQLTRLGNTPFTLAALRADIEGDPFVPSSLLNQLRREATDNLTAVLGAPATRAIADPIATLTRHRVPPPLEATLSDNLSDPQLHLLVRNAEQLDAALDLAPASLTLDYLDLYGLWPSVEKVRSSGIPLRVATPRVFKPGEEKIGEFLLKLDCELLVRAAGWLDSLQGKSTPPLTGDFSLNAANALTARILFDAGLTRLTPTHDLNAEQIAQLATEVGGHRLEAVAYQHLPVFHTEHCVFCRFLSNGTSYRDCGRPCEKHIVSLRDARGRAHPLVADVGCRNTVFGAEAQHASAHLQAWLSAGIRHFRLEFVHETPAELRRIVRLFDQALRGDLTAQELSSALGRTAPGGTTEGSLLVPPQWQSLPILD